MAHMMTKNNLALEQIYKLFQQSLLNDTEARRHAESALKELCMNSETIGLCFSIIKEKNYNMAVRLSCAVYVKNRLVRLWHHDEDEQSEAYSNKLDKSTIGALLFELYFQVPLNIRKILLPCFKKAINEEYKDHWSGLTQTLFQYLTLSMKDSPIFDHYLLSGALDILVIIVDVHCAKPHQQDPQLYQTGFPLLYTISQGFIEHISSERATEDMYLSLKKILKIYYTNIKYVLPRGFQNADHFNSWLQIFGQIIQVNVPPYYLPSQERADSSDLEACSFWKMKKWAFHIINKIYTSYGMPKEYSCTKEITEFAKYFYKTYSEMILSAYITQVEHMCQGAYLTDRIICIICDLLACSIKNAKLWKIIHGHLSLLLEGFILKQISYNEEDQELFEETPVDFINRMLEPIYYNDWNDRSSACSSLLVQLLKNRTETIFPLVQQFVYSLLLKPFSNNSQGIFKEKDSALLTLGLLVPYILKNESLARQLEEVIMSCIHPLLSTHHHLLKYRALWVIFECKKLEFSSIENVSMITITLLSLIARSNPLPIRFEAGLCLANFFKIEDLQSTLGQNVSFIIDAFLDITCSIDTDAMTDAFCELLDQFSQVIQPHALVLVQHLSGALMRLISDPKVVLDYSEANSKDNDLDDDDAVVERQKSFEMDPVFEKINAANGIIGIIGKLVYSIKNNHGLIMQLEVSLWDPVRFIFDRGIVDLYEDVFILIEDFVIALEGSISSNMHSCLAYLVQQMADNKMLDYVSEFIRLLNVVVVHMKSFVSENADIQHGILTFMKMVIFSSDDASEFVCPIGTFERVHIGRIMVTLSMNSSEKENPCLPQFIDWSFHLISPKPSTKTNMLYLEIILGLIGAKPSVGLQYLSHTQRLLPFWDAFMEALKNWKCVLSKSLCLTSLFNIMSTSTESLPIDMVQSYGHVWKALTVFIELPDKKESPKYDNDGDDDADDTTDNFDSDDGIETTLNNGYGNGDGFEDMENLKERGLMEGESIYFDKESETFDDDDEYDEEDYISMNDISFKNTNFHEKLKSTLEILPSKNLDFFNSYHKYVTAEEKHLIAEFLRGPTHSYLV